jgi:glycosyltransferase involved in cell wall biosynthesis
MHICLVIDSLAIGGAQKVVINFVKFAQQNNIDVSVVVLATAKTDTMRIELEKTGIPIHMFLGPKISNPFRIIRLIRFFKQQKVDLIQTHLAYANILGSLTGFLAGIPVICTMHSAMIHHEYYREILFRAEVFGLRFLSKGVICVAQAVADVFEGYIGKKKIVIVPNPVDNVLPISPEEKINIRTELMGDPEKTLLLTVGRLIPAKGYCDLVDAFAVISRKCPKTILVIVGPGRLKDELSEQIQRLNLSERAFLIGERADVPRLLAASDMFISSSHWEGMPIAVLEAMSAGLPVVSTAVAGLVDIMAGRGILVPSKNPPVLAQAVIDLLDHPEEMHQFGELSRQYVQEKHSLKAWGLLMITYFNKFLKKEIILDTAAIGECHVQKS